MQVFAVVNNAGIKTNVDVNVKNWLNISTCDARFIWNLSNWECKFDKSCDVGEYLDYKNCKCRKKFADKLVEKCIKNVDRNEMIYNTTLNDYEKVCNSCAICIVLFVISFLVINGFNSIFTYFNWYLKKGNTEKKIVNIYMRSIKHINMENRLH